MQNCGVRPNGCDVPTAAALALVPITASGDDDNANRIALERGTSDSSSRPTVATGFLVGSRVVMRSVGHAQRRESRF
jgi:hypothetical protein